LFFKEGLDFIFTNDEDESLAIIIKGLLEITSLLVERVAAVLQKVIFV
jgi:hypothetical protein